MSGDYSRFGFDPFRDYAGVLLQQGRPLTDRDWNDLVAQINRRLQAGTLDASGQMLVASTSPDAFSISIDAQFGLLISRGRIYVDGLLAENHGTGTKQWDAQLAELHGSESVPYSNQPFVPNAPAVPAAPYAVYLDVWRREVTQFEDPDLVEKALGVDSTTRLQTVWQVKWLGNVGNVDCSTPLDKIPGWSALTAPSAGRLSTATGQVKGDVNPCLIPPTGGYKGLENQLYRVEIHDRGPLGTATFKWSRDNASVVTRATRLIDASHIVVESVGKDDVLRFSDGDWIEITDDWLELNGLAGQLRKIKVGGGVDDATRTITLDQPLSTTGNPFPVDAQGSLFPERHTRIRRWDQKGKILDKAGTVYADLGAAGSTGAITVPTGGLQLLLESGILVSFDVDPAGGEFHVGDYWVSAARTSDASVETLDKAPPRGIHHHFCRLGIVSSSGAVSNCRPSAPTTGGDCECAACVTADGHNSGKFTIQAAISNAQSTGGKVCLGPGIYLLKKPIRIAGALALQLVGHGQTVLFAPPASLNAPVPAILIDGSSLVTLESFGLVLASSLRTVTDTQTISTSTPGIVIQNSASVTVQRCQFYSFGNQVPDNPAIALGGFVLQTIVRQNSFGFWAPDAQNNLVIGPGTGVGHLPTIAAKSNPLLVTFDIYVEDNFMQCGSSGINLDVLSYHAWQVGISNNFIGPSAVVGIAVAGIGVPAPASRVEITGNEVVVTGTSAGTFAPVVFGGTSGNGIVCGVSATRISDNDVLSLGPISGDGILLDAPLFPMLLDGCQILGNRVTGVGGIGIEIRAPLASAMIKQNTIENAGAGGIVMTGSARAPSSAQHLSIANNQLFGLVPNTANPIVGQLQAALGIRLDFVTAAEIEGNVIRDLGMDVTSNAPRVGIALVACSSTRIAGNQMSNIGPLNGAFGPSAGIAVIGPTFDRAEVSNNVIRRSDPGTQSTGAFWHALYLGPLGPFANSFNYKFVQIVGGQFVSGVWNRSLGRTIVIGTDVFAVVPEGAQLAAVRGNVMAAASFSAIAEVNVVAGSCIFAENQGSLTALANATPPLAVLSAQRVAASNNILTGGNPSLQITAPENKYTVLGNVTSSPITVDNQTLAGVWGALNVHA
jgi:hypothetical protein